MKREERKIFFWHCNFRGKKEKHVVFQQPLWVNYNTKKRGFCTYLSSLVGSSKMKTEKSQRRNSGVEKKKEFKADWNERKNVCIIAMVNTAEQSAAKE